MPSALARGASRPHCPAFAASRDLSACPRLTTAHHPCPPCAVLTYQLETQKGAHNDQRKHLGKVTRKGAPSMAPAAARTTGRASARGRISNFRNSAAKAMLSPGRSRDHGVGDDKPTNGPVTDADAHASDRASTGGVAFNGLSRQQRKHRVSLQVDMDFEEAGGDQLLGELDKMAKRHDGAVVQNVQQVRSRALEQDGSSSSGSACAPAASRMSSGRAPLARAAPPARAPSASPVTAKRGSIIIGSKAAVTPQEYLDHVDAVRAAWRYAAAQTIHDIRLAKRMKKQKKYGHFSIEQWGKTSRVFEKFFWFRSHMFIQYFLQGAVFCTSIYFAAIMKFGETYLFTQENFDTRLPEVVLLLVALGCVVVLGLLTLVPAILMQYTMVMHLSQLHAMQVVREATAAANAKTKSDIDAGSSKRSDKGSAGKSAGAVAAGGGFHSPTGGSPPGGGADSPGERPSIWVRAWGKVPKDWEEFETFANSSGVMNVFLALLLIDFFISVLASVLRTDQAEFCIAHCIGSCLTDPSLPLPGSARESIDACLARGEGRSGHAIVSEMDGIGKVAHALEITDLAIAFLFVVDVLMRFVASPRDFITSPWDVFDAAVVLAYAIIAPVLHATSGASEGLGTVLLLRVLRLLRFHRFVYAMTAGYSMSSVTESRRERLVSFCKRLASCGRWRGSDDEPVMELPSRGVESEDPIAAMKAKRAAAREAAAAAVPAPSGLSGVNHEAMLAENASAKAPAPVGSWLTGGRAPIPAPSDHACSA